MRLYEMTKHQQILINQLLKTLDINPLADNHISYEYAPYDLILEEECSNGKYCNHRRNPLICSKNHHNINNIIKQFEHIPKKMCRYERPWKILNGYPMRCTNSECWYSHLEGRSDSINYYILTSRLINTRHILQ
jgi:hypothetical protein